jgi:hypothetical protein
VSYQTVCNGAPKGLDDVYEFIDNVDSSTMAAAENNKQLWKVFSNPNVSGMLISDVKDNRLYVASTLSTAPPGFRQLARLQPEDYRDIAKRFISHLPADLQSQARNVLSQPSFWNQWFWLIRNSAAAQLPEWERTRITWIEEQFSARLSELDYASADAYRWLDELRNSRYLGKPQPHSLTSERAEGRVSDIATTSLASVAAVPQSTSILKDLAKKAIDAMTDEEIERIQIPLRLIGYARNPET